ncbi:hypothetical protein [Rhabdothermincola salaria]|uniref:hypothetical protein n=1 Tax=Rhabdothermincola salaria TaxID=2903142 RepID=UPI001E5A4C7E|nr:hypothetical protein [Rhabdothermincola salaria]MCD9625249.1 hypothetical protein [Rhabdothermincola salaria]
MRSLKVVVVDDDYWKRSSMAQKLNEHPTIAVTHALSQDETATWPLENWSGIDLAVVDIFDEHAPGEVGTDVFSGIKAIEILKPLPVRTFAITPHCQHPLVRLRLHHAGADWLYHRWEINDLDLLVEALLEPDDDHRPLTPSPSELEDIGCKASRPNDAIRLYEASPLYGRLRTEIGLKGLGVPRRKVDQLRVAVMETGFEGTEERSGAGERRIRAPRWPDIRDHLLAALGRSDVPATEVDRLDWGAGHR